MKSLSLFWRKFFVVLTGAGLAQIIPFATLPIITRLLPPAELGAYFIWLAGVSVLSVVYSLRLDIAVFNARTTEELSELIQTAFACTIALAGISYLLINILGFLIPEPDALLSLNEWRLEAITLAAVWSINMTLQNAYIYGAQFKRQAGVRVIQAACVATAQITAALSHWGVHGMIILQTIITSIAVLWNILDLRKKYDLNPAIINIKSIAYTLRYHWRFPVFSMPADFIGSLSAQLPLLVTGNRFGAESAGQLSLTNKALAGPTKLLAGSILSVFKEEAAREYRETRQCSGAFKKTLKSLILIGAPLFAILFYFSELIFETFFGPQWRVAGEYASILAPMLFLQFVSSPLSYVLYIANKQLLDLTWQVAVLSMTAVAFFASDNIKVALIIYSVGCSIFYGVYLYLSFKSSKKVIVND
jgi:O-antigen/teichoic acid export membrane protein